MASAPILHLGTWDGYTPVMLPYGAKTMDGIVAASNGVMVPFIIFVLFMFRFFYHNQWLQEYNRLAASSGQLHADTCCSAPRATMGDIPAHRLRYLDQSSFAQPAYMQQQSLQQPIAVWTVGGGGP